MSLWWYWILITLFYEFVDSKINGFNFIIVLFFNIFCNVILLRCFVASPHILTASRHHLYILFIIPVCGASHHHQKNTHLHALVLSHLLLLWDYLIFVVNRVYEFSFVRLFLMLCRLFWSVLALLFFFRFWLMLGAASPLVGTKFSRLWCSLPVIGLPSIVPAHLGFQDLVFGDLTYMLSFIARGWFHGLLILFRLPFLLCSLVSLQLSLVFASLVALPFAMFANPGLDNDFLCVCSIGLDGCFWC